jgi:CO/xanthine dehydrogenase FAD-binding subunit
VPTIIEAAGAALVGGATDPEALERGIEAAAAAFDNLDAVEDLNGSADYKRHLGAVLLASTTRAAVQEAIAHA